MSTRRGSWRPSTPAAGARLPFLPWSFSSAPRAGFRSRAAPGLGFLQSPAQPAVPAVLWVCARVSVRVRSGRARSKAQTLALECEPSRGFCPGRGGTCGPERELVALTETLQGATDDPAWPAKGSLWEKKAQLSLNNLGVRPWFFRQCGAALCPGRSLIRSKLESRPPLYAWPPLAICHPLWSRESRVGRNCALLACVLGAGAV